jgi:hypothetical protein
MGNRKMKISQRRGKCSTRFWRRQNWEFVPKAIPQAYYFTMFVPKIFPIQNIPVCSVCSGKTVWNENFSYHFISGCPFTFSHIEMNEWMNDWMNGYVNMLEVLNGTSIMLQDVSFLGSHSETHFKRIVNVFSSVVSWSCRMFKCTNLRPQDHIIFQEKAATKEFQDKFHL